MILCGDLNVAHNEIDIKNAKANIGNVGFSYEERGKFAELLNAGVIGAYTWWIYMFNARANNTGWRIDYFVLSERLKPELKDCILHPEIMGSDHCPVELEIF